MNVGRKVEPELRRYRPNGKWYIWFPAAFGRKSWKQNTFTRDRAEAEAMLNSSNVRDMCHMQGKDAIEQVFFSKVIIGSKITVRKAIDMFFANCQIRGLADSTITNQKDMLDHWCSYCQVQVSPISSIQPGHCSAFVNRKGDIALSTREWNLTVLKLFCRFCVAEKCMPRNPCDGLRVITQNLTDKQIHPVPKEPFTEEEMDRLQAAVEPDSDWYGIFLFCRQFGMRREDICSLEWGMVKNGRLRMSVRKTRRRVMVDEPLPQNIIDWLAKRPRDHSMIEMMKQSRIRSIRERAVRIEADGDDKDFIFKRMAYLVIDGHSEMVSAEFSAIRDKCGIPSHKKLHSFRRTVVTREMNAMMDKLGGPEKAVLTSLLAQHGIKAIQKLIGHAAGSMVTVNTYFAPKPTAATPQP